MDIDQDEIINSAQTKGWLSDGITLARALLTPVIMFVIIVGWPKNDMAVLASVLFTIAALSDIADDLIGGPETAIHRQFGWFDDIADTILVLGSLLALSWVIYKAGIMSLWFLIPTAVIVLREVIVGLTRGFELQKNGWPETKLGNIKTGLLMFSICLLIATPWLTTWTDNLIQSDSNIVDRYVSASPHIWIAGQVLLWLAALLSLITGIRLIANPSGAANDS